MNNEATIARLEAKLDRIERKLTELLGEKKKTTWVKVGTVVDLTGWTKEELRRMRENGIIKFKKEDSGMWYAIESLPPALLKALPA